MRECGNKDCGCSTGIHEGLTFGRGKLDEHGYWEFPCRICAEAADARMDIERAELVAEQVRRYRSIGFSEAMAVSAVRDLHEWLFLSAWPYE